MLQYALYYMRLISINYKLWLLFPHDLGAAYLCTGGRALYSVDTFTLSTQFFYPIKSNFYVNDEIIREIFMKM